MKLHVLLITTGLATLLLCCAADHSEIPDPQFIRVDFRYGFRNIVNTFDGLLTKDLVLDGTITVPFWLRTEEQQAILDELDREDFFALPDTIASVAGTVSDPNPGLQTLRIGARGMTKTVVWQLPVDTGSVSAHHILRIAARIQSVVESSARYPQLPAPRGGYL